MGQYGNQPDFATIVAQANIEEVIEPSAIYIGELIDSSTLAEITVLPAGNTDTVTFRGLSGGTFMPVVVTKITSVSGIIIDNVLVYR